MDGHHVAPVAAYREQIVEVALGPKGAFEDGNIGTLTRRVAAGQIVSALPPRVRNRKPPKAPGMPRVVELLRKALEWQALLESGEVPSQAAIARREGLTRARVTQVLWACSASRRRSRAHPGPARDRRQARNHREGAAADCADGGPDSAKIGLRQVVGGLRPHHAHPCSCRGSWACRSILSNIWAWDLASSSAL